MIRRGDPGITNGLVGHWRLDEASGAHASEAQGIHSRNGLLKGVAGWGHDDGPALSLNGGYVDVPYDSALNVTGAGFTVSAWWRYQETGTWQCTVVQPWYDGIHGDPYFKFLLGAGNGTAMPRFFVGWGLSDWSDIYASGTAMQVGRWYHLAGTYDGAVMRLYVNGVQGAALGIVRSMGAAAGGIHIGAHATGGEVAAGLVRDVRIYNRTLSEIEIGELARSRSAPPSRRWWFMASSAALQTHRPSGVLSAGAWTEFPSGTIEDNLADSSDTTGARSSVGAASDTLDVEFPSITTPGAGDVTFYFRLRKTP
jgi:hypothetical protein